MSSVGNYHYVIKKRGKNEVNWYINAYDFYSSIDARKQLEVLLGMAGDIVTKITRIGKPYAVGYGGECNILVVIDRKDADKATKLFTKWRQSLRAIRTYDKYGRRSY